MKRYITILNLLLATGIIYIGVLIFYNVIVNRLGDTQLPAAGRISAATSAGENIKPFSSYSAITERNLFGSKEVAEPPPTQVDIDSLKQTDLNLKLWGTVTGDEKEAYAVIEEAKGREQNLYRIGDTIETAVVKMILREKVVLTVDGNDEILQMEEMDGAGKPSSIKRLPARTSAPAQQVTLNRSQIEAAFQDANELMTQVRIRPHLEQGKPAGYMLTGIKPNSIFRRMGLRNGDVITGVDGREIGTVDDALKFYENLKSSSSMAIQIKRRGREKTIDYRIE